MARGRVAACRDNRPWSSKEDQRRRIPHRLPEAYRLGPIYGLMISLARGAGGRTSAIRRGDSLSGWLLSLLSYPLLCCPILTSDPFLWPWGIPKELPSGNGRHFA